MQKEKFFPGEQRVLVLPETEKKVGSIYIPETAEQDRPRRVKIIVSGKGSQKEPMMYHPGQTVYISKYSGLELTLNLDGTEREYLVLNQMDIMGHVEPIKE